MRCEQIGKFLKVELLTSKPSRLTNQWCVKTNQNDIVGMVRWVHRFRQYAFESGKECIFNVERLDDITKFIRRINDTHWKIKRAVEELTC